MSPSPPRSAGTARLLSVDALRGFDMFWIIGADALVTGLKPLADFPPVQFAARQLEHAPWHGMTFYDLIFPLFVYIMGVSIPLALARRSEELADRRAIYRHVFRRFLILYALGVLYYGGLANPWGEIRWVGVLQRIAVCYLCGSLLFMHFRTRGLVAWLVVLLGGYWALMAWGSTPGFPPGDLTPEGNFAGHVDRTWLPGRAWNKQWGWDPEGLLSTIPAVGSCLLGILSGEVLRRGAWSPRRKAGTLAGLGLALVALGFAWSVWFPINKQLWTSSYVLVAGGYSALLLALFYLMIDVWQWRRWCLVFVVIGANAIFIYMAVELVPFRDLALRLVGGDVARLLGSYAEIAAAAVQLSLEIALLYWMYARGIFIRV